MLMVLACEGVSKWDRTKIWHMVLALANIHVMQNNAYDQQE
jgi:hypothetical protein